MKWNGFLAVCVCGKLCTSKPGLTMHQAWCVKAKKFKRSGGTGLIEVLKPQMRLIDVAQNLVDMTYDIALDIHSALTNQNKSAARRARVNLNSLRQEILALRKDLNHVKNDYKK